MLGKKLRMKFHPGLCPHSARRCARSQRQPTRPGACPRSAGLARRGGPDLGKPRFTVSRNRVTSHHHEPNVHRDQQRQELAPKTFHARDPFLEAETRHVLSVDHFHFVEAGCHSQDSFDHTSIVPRVTGKRNGAERCCRARVLREAIAPHAGGLGERRPNSGGGWDRPGATTPSATTMVCASPVSPACTRPTSAPTRAREITAASRSCLAAAPSPA